MFKVIYAKAGWRMAHCAQGPLPSPQHEASSGEGFGSAATSTAFDSWNPRPALKTLPGVVAPSQGLGHNRARGKGLGLSEGRTPNP